MGTRTRIIWGKWDCTSCGTTGISAEPPPGEPAPRCPKCGNPREQAGGEAAYLDNARTESGRVIGANVADTPEEIDIATAGPDWQCPNCGTDNRAGRALCMSCEAPQYPEVARQTDYVIERARRALTLAFDPREPLLSPAVWSARVRVYATVALILLAVALLVGGMLWAAQTHEVPATATNMTWNQTIYVDVWTQVSKEAWKATIPTSASVPPTSGSGERAGADNVRNCASKHQRDERYVCGSDNVCETKTRQVANGQDCHESCSTRSNDNGSFTETCHDVCSTQYRSEPYTDCHDVTRYCTRPIYADWCAYDTWEWQERSVQPLAGVGKETRWSPYHAAARERLRRESRYAVVLTYDDGNGPETWILNPATEPDYQTWTVGDPAFIHVRNLGTVADVTRTHVP